MSRRIYKETTAAAPQGAGASLYHYEGWNLCAEYTATSISGGTTSSITALQRAYTWGPDLSGSMQGAGGVGGLLTIEEKSGPHTGKYYPLYDGNGNVTELIKSGGPTGTTLVAHYEYDPFGNLTQSDDSDGSGYNAVNPWQFSTKYHDQETGFSYYGYRYYDPVTGRWPSRDPIGEGGGTNLYGMVGNNLISEVDFLGMQTLHVNHPRSKLAACNKRLNEGKENGYGDPEIQKIIADMKKRGCKVPKVSCKCCSGPLSTSGGYFTSAENSITICAKNQINNGKFKPSGQGADGSRKTHFEVTLYHEFIHAWQKCTKFNGYDDSYADKSKESASQKDRMSACAISICIEIQAYYNANCNHLKGDLRKECVKRGVRYSSRSACKRAGYRNTDAIINAVVDRGYEKCAKSLNFK